MIGFTERLTEALSIPCADLSPANVALNNSTPQTVGPVDMSKFKRAMAVVQCGVQGATNTLVQFMASANSGNSFSNIAGGPTAIINNNTWLVTLEIRADQMPANTRYLQLSLLTTGGVNTGAFLAALIIAAQAAYSPASAYDVANSNTINVSRQVM